MAARKHTGIFRSPRTRQLKRQNEAHGPYVRAKRRPSQFREWYAEPHVRGPERSWKAQYKKRRQWMCGPLKRWWRLELSYEPRCYGVYGGYTFWLEDLPGGLDRFSVRHVGSRCSLWAWETESWWEARDEAKRLIEATRGALYLHDKRAVFRESACTCGQSDVQ